jgi:hypothetical protein
MQPVKPTMRGPFRRGFSVAVLALVAGCASTTPELDRTFGDAVNKATSAQKIQSPAPKRGALPNAVEFDRALDNHLGQGAASPVPTSANDPAQR